MPDDSQVLKWKEPTHLASEYFRKMELANPKERLTRWAIFFGAPIVCVAIRAVMAKQTSLLMYLVVAGIGFALGSIAFLGDSWTRGIVQWIEFDDQGIKRTFIGGDSAGNEFWPWKSIALARIDRHEVKEQELRLLTLIGTDESEMGQLAISDSVDDAQLEATLAAYGRDLLI